MNNNAAIKAWEEGIGVMFDIRPLTTDRSPFRAKVDAFMLGELALGIAQASSQQFDRARNRLARDGIDHILLQFYVAGHCGRRDTQRARQTQPGDLLLCDLAQPLATSASDFTNLTLVVPRRLLTPLLPSLDDRHLNIFNGGQPIIALLRKHLQALHESATHLSTGQAQSLITPTLQLVAAAIQGAVTDTVQAGVEHSIAAVITQYVDAHLHIQKLDAAQVAAQFGISLRKLHYLFEARGGFANYVQKRRLERCRDMLSKAEFAHLSLARIAEYHGFVHMETFSRAFRRQFGITARALRALSLEGTPNPMPQMMEGSAWSAWIAGMK